MGDKRPPWSLSHQHRLFLMVHQEESSSTSRPLQQCTRQEHTTHNAQRTAHSAQRTTHHTTHNTQHTTHNTQHTTHNTQHAHQRAQLRTAEQIVNRPRVRISERIVEQTIHVLRSSGSATSCAAASTLEAAESTNQSGFCTFPRRKKVRQVVGGSRVRTSCRTRVRASKATLLLRRTSAVLTASPSLSWRPSGSGTLDGGG